MCGGNSYFNYGIFHLTLDLNSESQSHTPPTPRFEATEEFKKDIERAIKRSKVNKADGIDEIFTEMFQLNATLMAGAFSLQICMLYQHLRRSSVK